MKINFDFRLLDVSMELYVLEDHYDLIEKQLAHLSHAEQATLSEYQQKENLTPEDPEWDFARQECDHKVEFLLPRFFWGSFIVSLYAVFETSLIEVAKLLQEKQNQGISINDLKGEFLTKSKKYYDKVLKFELCDDKKIWQDIKDFANVRHAIAHANGRIDMLTKENKASITKLIKSDSGISSHYNYLIVDSSFAKEALENVSISLRSLVERYKNVRLPTKHSASEET